MRNLLLIVASLFTISAAAEGSILGFWKTIDEKTKTPKGLVEFTEKDGVIQGHLRETYKEPRKEFCEACKGDKKGKPLIGLEIVCDVKSQGKDEWGGGKILDPENGKTYRVTLWSIEDGKKLKVRGYVGPFFRTQYWERAEAPAKAAAPTPAKAPAK